MNVFAYRNRSLLDLAHRVHECQLMIPGVCEGYSLHGCEPAHSNFSRHGKGKSRKADDVFHAAACRSCHAYLDQGGKLNREDAIDIFTRGFERTMLLYFKNGWLECK